MAEQSCLQERVERITKSSDTFIDNRGRIDNYPLSYPINMANIITTKKNEGEYPIRANHYHPEQTQMCLVVSGSYIGVYKDLSLQNSQTKSHIVRAGDLVTTPPMVAHAMIFLEDTTFINLVGGNREHDKFDKEHTMRYSLVSPEEAVKYVELHKNNSETSNLEGK